MYSGKLSVLSLGFVIALLVAACSVPIGTSTPAATTVTDDTSTAHSTQMFPQNADGYADISVEQLAGMMESKDFTLVNVHIPYQGELPETDLFISFDEIADKTDELPSKDATIVLYCRSGSMSTTAAKTLTDMGYTNVLELDGGFNAWQAAGYDLLNKQ